MARNLDHAYDEYLKAHASDVLEHIHAYPDRLKEKGFRYGRFVIPSFYKGHFLSHRQVHLLKRAGKTLNQVLNTACHLYFEEGHLSHMFRLRPEALKLIAMDPGYSEAVVFSRYNTLLEGERLKVLEFNCDSPVGAGYADQAEDTLLSEEPLKDFFRQHEITASPRAQAVLDSLLSVYEEFGGYETPNIAIVDWRNVRTTPEFQYLKTCFEERGYKTVIADPRELRFKGGGLYYKNVRIRLILRRFFFDELLERLDETGDMIKAYEAKAVCIVNPLRSRLASTKAIHSILTNPEYDHFFTDNENAIKHDCVPWTRRISDCENFFGYRKMYLIDFLKDQKESLVLKPCAGSGGKDVRIGVETRDEDWNEVIDRALKGDWVVQEYVDIPVMTVPGVINQKLEFSYKKYNFNMLVFGGRYAGGFTRLSDESVINVARKGGLLPALISDQIPDRM